MVFGSVSFSSKVVLASAFPVVVAGVGFSKNSPDVNPNHCPAKLDIQNRHFWTTADKNSWFGWAVGGPVPEQSSVAEVTGIFPALDRGVICATLSFTTTRGEKPDGGDVELTYTKNKTGECDKDYPHKVEAVVSQSVGRSIPKSKSQTDSCKGDWAIQQGREKGNVFFAPYQCRIGAPYVYSNAKGKEKSTCPIVYDMMFYFVDENNQYFSLTPVSGGNKFKSTKVSEDITTYFTNIIQNMNDKDDVPAEIIQMFMPYSAYQPDLNNKETQQYFANYQDYILVQKAGCGVMNNLTSGVANSGLLDNLKEKLPQCQCITFPNSTGVATTNCKQFFNKDHLGQGLSLGANFRNDLFPVYNNYMIALGASGN